AVEWLRINESTSTVVFYEGFNKSILCASSPSNPSPTIRWWLDSVQMNDSTEYHEMETIDGLYAGFSTIYMNFNRVDRKREILCDAYICGQDPVSSKRLRIDIW
ncbi:hypothetical protein ACJMK2_008836, partial [Sinanodonta woodiana]